MLQDIKDMLLGIAVAVLGAALTALSGFLSLCGFVICLVGLTMAKYAHDRHAVVKSDHKQANIPEKEE